MVLLSAGINIDSIAQLLTMIVVFVFVLVLACVTSRFAGGFQRNQLNGSNIKVIETTRISNNKYFMVIYTGGRYILIAVCKDSVTYLCELDPDKVSIRENINAGDEFKRIFAKFKGSDKVDDDEKES